MHALLVGLFAWLSAGVIQRALVGAGLAIATYTILSPVIEGSISSLTTALSGSGAGDAGPIISAILYCGISDFMSIIVSAYITRFAFLQLRAFVVRQQV